MTSSFKFEGYKIDEIDLKMRPDAGLVTSTAFPGNWNFHLQIRQPYFFSANNLYVGGLSFRAMMFAPSEKMKQLTEDESLVTLKVGIAGAFTTEGQFGHETEEKLVSNQIPAILLPYLRSTVSTITANAGFGALILPLMNIQKWADAQAAKLKVQVVTSQPANSLPASTSEKS